MDAECVSDVDFDNNNQMTVNREAWEQVTRQIELLSANARPSKPDAAKLAATTIDAWITSRSIALHRDARTYLIEDLAEAFGAPEVKEAEGVG